jgi:hypothetical protein
MVRALLIGVFIAILLPLAAQEVKVDVDVQQRSLSAGAPVDVIVTISRPKGLNVEPNSFLYKGKQVRANHMSDASHSSISIVNGRRIDRSGVVSTYQLQLPSVEEGLHLLDPISVTIGGQQHSSSPESITVEQGVEVRHFKLEAKRDPISGPLYPGQKLRAGYRIYFVDDVELTVEDLPLMNLEGFRHIGDRKVATGMEGKFNVHALAQDFEATKPGTYYVPESVVEGYVYVSDLFGRRRFREPRLRATAPPQEIVVLPFPEEGKPPSFQGAVGSYTFTALRVGTGPVRVGDKVVVRLRMEGDHPYMVHLPAMDRQPGFRSNFRMSDLPPTRQEEERAAYFDVELRPLSEEITEVPPISWTYFEPDSQRYRTVTSNPIPLEVTPAPLEQEVLPLPKPIEEREEKVEEEPEVADWQDADQVREIEITSVYPLTREALKLSWWQTSQALLLLPAGGAAFLLQWLLLRRPKRSRTKVLSAKALLRQAEKEKGEKALPLVVRALHRRLEEGASEDRTQQIEKLLLHLEEQRFAGTKLGEEKIVQLLNEAGELVKRGGE